MNLAEFVEEGIRAAQKKDGGGAIGAGATPISSMPGSLLAQDTRGNLFTVVEFDASILAETSGGGKGALKVWSVGSIEAGGKRSDQQTNRVRFSVQVKIPEGEKAE